MPTLSRTSRTSFARPTTSCTRPSTGAAKSPMVKTVPRELRGDSHYQRAPSQSPRISTATDVSASAAA
eukprot:6718291-Pyramimonas_sp.AAC.1